MASSKVISKASPNQDPPRQPSLRSSTLSTLLADLQTQLPNQPQNVTMDDLFKDIYTAPPPPAVPVPREEAKSVDDLWKEIVAGGEQRRERMTLEDFLTKAGAAAAAAAVEVNDNPGPGAFPVDATAIDAAAQFAGFGNNGLVDYQRVPAAGGGGGRGKRRAVEEPPMDKASQQKQKRMIKNRESAARSRERKQAYTIELETLVTQLEEENARLRGEEAESNKKRLKQLMENLIPVEEKERSPRVLRRVRSVHW